MIEVATVQQVSPLMITENRSATGQPAQARTLTTYIPVQGETVAVDKMADGQFLILGKLA